MTIKLGDVELAIPDDWKVLKNENEEIILKKRKKRKK